MNSASPTDPEDDFQLAPPDGLSPNEIFLMSRQVSVSRETAPPTQPSRLRSLFVITFFVAVGLAGRSFASPMIFSAILGVVAIILYIALSILAPEHPASRWVIRGVIVAYLASAVHGVIAAW